MTSKDLLAYVTTGAMVYIQNVVSSKNKADYNKLKKLFDEQRFEAKSFDDTDLNILSFDWQCLERDRNWWWQLQALPFLNWYTNSFALQSDEEQSRYFSLCLDAIHAWVKQAKLNKESPLAWHDHATAFRVRNLTNWFVFCHSAGLVDEAARAEALSSLIIEHLGWLHEDQHYSKHTNHGFDQAMIALTIALMFDHDGFEIYRKHNRERLKDEVTFAFTAEGVHKENSPGYQKMMLGRLKQLRTLNPLGENEISHIAERYIEKAESFLRAITLPNGFLPMIGDTRGEDEGLPYVPKEKVDVLDYSSSGYVIIRGIDGRNKTFFILLKNTHESDYHRHDDDMMIYIFYDNEVVLGDGGLYKHDEKDERRLYLRSFLAHSVPYIEGKTVKKRSDLLALPTIEYAGGLRVKMESMMFGKSLRRIVQVNCDQGLQVNINDKYASGSSDGVWSNFFLGRGVPLLLVNKSLEFKFSTFSFELINSGKGEVKINYGWVKGFGGAFLSNKYGVIEDSVSISVYQGESILRFNNLKEYVDC